MAVNKVRGIRGAVSVSDNTEQAILQATQELLREIIKANQILSEDIISVIFSVTKDLNVYFPARAARELGWHDVPLLDLQEAEGPGLAKVVRVLLHVNTNKSQQEIRHIYLGEAAKLRPDLIKHI